MPSQTGLRSVGVYLPRRRIPRAVIADAHSWALPALKGMASGERTLGSWDEDALTMAVEAARQALDGAVDRVTLASTTAPFASLQNASLVAAALGMPQSVRTQDSGGTTRSALRAVVDACEASSGSELVIGSDRRAARPGSAQELLYGHAAAAVTVGTGDVLAAFLGAEVTTRVFVDHFREHGETFDYYWEERWIRDEGVARFVPETISRLLKRLGIEPQRVAHFALTGAPPRSDALVAKAVGIPPNAVLPDLMASIGDTGSAHCLLQAAAALERASAGELILLASFGQGCEAALFEAGPALANKKCTQLRDGMAARLEERAYLRMLSFENVLQPEWGMRAETDQKTALTQLYRAADQILPFVGGKCGQCGTAQFPRMPTCVNCGAAGTQTPHPLANEKARVVTCTADWLQYSPSPPLRIGLVQFESGARVLMELVDVDGKTVNVGDPLAMRFRIKERDNLRHFARYFWKATPAVSEVP